MRSPLFPLLRAISRVLHSPFQSKQSFQDQSSHVFLLQLPETLISQHLVTKHISLQPTHWANRPNATPPSKRLVIRPQFGEYLLVCDESAQLVIGISI